jgi:hypothetical protein
VSVVGDGEVNRFLDQMGKVLLEIVDSLPVELFHAVTQVDSNVVSSPAELFCALLTENG